MEYNFNIFQLFFWVYWCVPPCEIMKSASALRPTSTHFLSESLLPKTFYTIAIFVEVFYQRVNGSFRNREHTTLKITTRVNFTDSGSTSRLIIFKWTVKDLECPKHQLKWYHASRSEPILWKELQIPTLHGCTERKWQLMRSIPNNFVSHIYILNETSKPPVNKTHFFNIAHLLLNFLKLYLTQYIWGHVSVDWT